jgi:formimidoylglutamate deiminase
MQYINAAQALTATGWLRDVQVAIAPDGHIAHVGAPTQAATQRVALLLPAPTNLHSHAFQRAMAGLTEARGPDASDSFWTWRRLMYRFLDRLTPDHVQAIAALVFMEMLEAGYASVAEFHYLHHGPDGTPYDNLAEMSERIVAAARTTGIGLTLLPVLYQYGGCDRRPLQGGQLRFSNDIERFTRLFEGARAAVESGPADYGMGIAPHSLRAVDTSGLQGAVDLAPNRPLHMHLAEQVAEVDEVSASLGARPVDWLLDNHAVNDRWCLIHCTQMSASETKHLAASGAVAGLCPITESNLGDGIFNATAYLGAGGRFGIGSDSNVHISLFEELKTLEYSQRLRDRSRAALATGERSTGRVLFAGATQGGAQAAGRNAGAIAPGKLADLVAIQTDNQWLCNRQGDAVLDSLIFGGHGQRAITDVWSAGRHVIKDARHSQRKAIIDGFTKTLDELGQDI